MWSPPLTHYSKHITKLFSKLKTLLKKKKKLRSVAPRWWQRYFFLSFFFDFIQPFLNFEFYKTLPKLYQIIFQIFWDVTHAKSILKTQNTNKLSNFLVFAVPFVGCGNGFGFWVLTFSLVYDLKSQCKAACIQHQTRTKACRLRSNFSSLPHSQEKIKMLFFHSQVEDIMIKAKRI